MKNDANAFVGRVHAHELAWHRPGKLCGAHESFTDPFRAGPPFPVEMQIGFSDN